MATLTKGYTFLNNDTVTPFKLNSLVDLATITGIVDADIAAAAGISDTKLATIATANKVANSATTATAANTANAIVARDASGNFSAGTITGNLTGNVTGNVTGMLQGTGALFLVPTGAVMAFAMNSAPSGWLAADGSAVSRATYANLFAAIGTTYGVGDGSATFTLPDLRGYFVRGAGTNADGTSAGTFGAKQADSIRDHTHSWRYDGIGRAAGGSVTASGNGLGGGIYDIGMTAGTAGPETRPKNIPMLYCIKF